MLLFVVSGGDHGGSTFSSPSGTFLFTVLPVEKVVGKTDAQSQVETMTMKLCEADGRHQIGRCEVDFD